MKSLSSEAASLLLQLWVWLGAVQGASLSEQRPWRFPSRGGSTFDFPYIQLLLIAESSHQSTFNNSKKKEKIESEVNGFNGEGE